MKPKPDPARVEECKRLRAAGVSYSKIADQLGISQACVRIWLNGRKPLGRPKEGEKSEPTLQGVGQVVVGTPSVSLDAVSEIKRQMAELRANADLATKAGNHAAAQRYLRDLAQLMPPLIRAQREQRADGDNVIVGKAELEAARGTWRARVQAALSRPMLCSQCSRALSIAWGEGTYVEEK